MGKRLKKTTSAKRSEMTPESKASAVPPHTIHHTLTLLAALYRHQMEKIGGKNDNALADGATKFLYDLMVRFEPRDAVEEMLFSQMVLTYGRMTYLTSYADQQGSIKWAAMMHEAADRAANTFRRQMLALAEYRRSPRAKSFTAIGQANIAHQQVVQNRIPENENAANEQGSTRGTKTPKMLPPDAGGAASPADVRAPGAAVAGEHGAEDTGREGTRGLQCPKTR